MVYDEAAGRLAPEAREVAQNGDSRPCRPVCTAGAKAHGRDSGEEAAKTRSKGKIQPEGCRHVENPEGNSNVPNEEGEGGTKGGGSGT